MPRSHLREVNIKMITGKTLIGVFCDECKEHTTKTVKYLRGHIKSKRDSIYCSRECANKGHSKRMRGKGNPNHGGKFHGKTMRDRTMEERKEIGKKISETMIRKGISRGKNNPKWAGGQTKFTCTVCEKETYKKPYITRMIISGKQQPTCSEECSLVLGRRNIEYENTSIEIAVANELTERGIKYEEQYNLGDKFRLDFLLPEYGIVIECDGDYWHNLPEVKRRDRRKNSYIEACGYSLYRFWEYQINADVEACVDIVLAEINEREAVV